MDGFAGRFKSWRTSAVGIGALVYAVADLVTMYHNEEWDANRIGISVMAILTGLGFISARDNAASVQAHAVQAVALDVAIAKADDAQEIAKEAAKVAVQVEKKVT